MQRFRAENSCATVEAVVLLLQRWKEKHFSLSTALVSSWWEYEENVFLFSTERAQFCLFWWDFTSIWRQQHAENGFSNSKIQFFKTHTTTSIECLEGASQIVADEFVHQRRFASENSVAKRRLYTNKCWYCICQGAIVARRHLMNGIVRPFSWFDSDFDRLLEYFDTLHSTTTATSTRQSAELRLV